MKKIIFELFIIFMIGGCSRCLEECGGGGLILTGDIVCFKI